MQSQCLLCLSIAIFNLCSIIDVVQSFSNLLSPRLNVQLQHRYLFRSLSKLSDTAKPFNRTKWAADRGLEEGYGGIWPGDPNAAKFNVTARSKKTGETVTLMVPADRYIYFYFEEMGVDLPIINKLRMCRQGCCTICSAKLEQGRVKMDTPLGLLKEMRNEGYALTCCAYPRSDIICELQDEDEMYIRQWSDTFESGGIQWGGFLPDDD